VDDGGRHLQNGEGAPLTAERLLALFSDMARRRGVTRDVDPPSSPDPGPPQSGEAAEDRKAEINRASTTMLLVAMAFARRGGDAGIEALLRSEDPDVRLASTFYLGDILYEAMMSSGRG
jgi:hypothetical protein